MQKRKLVEAVMLAIVKANFQHRTAHYGTVMKDKCNRLLLFAPLEFGEKSQIAVVDADKRNIQFGCAFGGVQNGAVAPENDEAVDAADGGNFRKDLRFSALILRHLHKAQSGCLVRLFFVVKYT